MWANWCAGKYKIVIFVCIGMNMEICYGAPTEDDDCVYMNNVLDFTEKHTGGLAMCALKDNPIVSALKTGEQYCVMKCVLTKLGILNKDGNLDMIVGMTLMETTIPQILQNETKSLAMKCGGDAMGIDLNDDEMCRSYKPLITCIRTNMSPKLRSIISKIVFNFEFEDLVSPIKCGGRRLIKGVKTQFKRILKFFDL